MERRCGSLEGQDYPRDDFFYGHDLACPYSILKNERGTKTSRCLFIFIYHGSELVFQNEPKTNKSHQAQLGTLQIRV